jgi:hypothetical protein
MRKNRKIRLKLKEPLQKRGSPRPRLGKFCVLMQP